MYGSQADPDQGRTVLAGWEGGKVEQGVGVVEAVVLRSSKHDEREELEAHGRQSHAASSSHNVELVAHEGTDSGGFDVDLILEAEGAEHTAVAQPKDYMVGGEVPHEGQSDCTIVADGRNAVKELVPEERRNGMCMVEWEVRASLS